MTKSLKYKKKYFSSTMHRCAYKRDGTVIFYVEIWSGYWDDNKLLWDIGWGRIRLSILCIG